MTLPWGVYYCFVAWQSVEQLEAGDTLLHTFEILDWSYCQTKWFAFRGTVADVLSPSVSALFEHHHPGILIQIEEQTESDAGVGLDVTDTTRAGQRLTIPGRTVIKLAFKLVKLGNPTGDVTLAIHGLETGLTQSKVLGNAADLPTVYPPVDWQEVTFDTPVPMNELARIYVQFEAGSPADQVGVRVFTAYDIKPDEVLDIFKVGWYTQPGSDCTYRYWYR
ncbi:hypothetical protein ES708_26081 [subsurface metagenome]